MPPVRSGGRSLGIESGGDPTPTGPGATDPGVSSPAEPARSVPTGLVSGPPQAAGGWASPPPAAGGWASQTPPTVSSWTSQTPPGYWPSGAPAGPRGRLPIVATILAVGVGATFFLPWATFSFSFPSVSGYSGIDVSSSLITMLDQRNWVALLWPELVLLGFVVAFITALFDAALRLSRRAATMEAMGFAAVAVGVVMGIVTGFEREPFGSGDSLSLGLSPGFGAWLCLLAAVAGAIVAVVRLAEPNALMISPAVPVAGPAPGLFQPGYPMAPYSRQFGAPYPPYAPQPAPPYPPQYPPVWAPQAPLPTATQSATPTSDPGASDAGTLAPDLAGAPGTLVVLLAGRTLTRAVKLGESLVLGSDPASSVALADPRVSPHHASIQRLGPGWLVRGLDEANPTWLLDATGRAQLIRGELGLRSGELLIGGAQVRLYPPPS